MKCCDNLSKMDMVFFSSEVEDLEATARSFLETASWMDCWTYFAKSLALLSKSDTAKVKCLFVADTKYQLLVAKTASTI